MQTFENGTLPPSLSLSLLATELGMTGGASECEKSRLPPLFSFAHSSLLNCTFSLRRTRRRRMAKWNAHRKARLISPPPRPSRSSYPFVRPARPLPSLPNDFTALVNTVVRFESPLAPRSPRRSNKESDCTFIFSAFCSKLSRNKSGGRGAPSHRRSVAAAGSAPTVGR